MTLLCWGTLLVEPRNAVKPFRQIVATLGAWLARQKPEEVAQPPHHQFPPLPPHRRRNRRSQRKFRQHDWQEDADEE